MILSNCSAREDSWESFGLQEDIELVNPKGNQSWIFIRRTDAEAEAPILWLPDAKIHLIEKDPDAWKDRAEGEMDDRGWDDWMSIIDSMDMSLNKLWEIVKDREAWYAAYHGIAKNWMRLSDWITMIINDLDLISL